MAFSLVRYSQQDPRWKNDKLGGGPDNIGHIGCAVTCVAMYSSGWGFTETPATLNQKLKRVGGYVGQAIVWAALTKIHPSLRCTGLTISGNSPAPLSEIGASLAEGQPVIVEVDFSPAAGLQTHWVLLYRDRGNDYYMLDPWPYPTETDTVSLMSRYSHGKTLPRSIKAIAWYQAGLVTPAPGPVETDLYVWPLASVTAGLRLHPEPSLSSPANYAEMPGVRLNVIEDAATARAKIGKQNEWIFIRDPNGHQGYVAAWYVEEVTSEVPTPTPIPPIASEPKKFQVRVKSSVGRLGLVVRDAPSRGGTRINVERAGNTLTVLEPAETGMPKIGVAGQWLAIKATNNKRGYVAAQYVEEVTSEAPTPIPPIASDAPTPTPIPPVGSDAPAPAPIPPVGSDAPAPAPIPPVGSEPTKFQVRVKRSVGQLGLVVRDAPSRDGTRINLEKAGNTLTVLEPEETAMPKIGVAGQWLAIKATNNDRGYVAAQYVELIP
jgi:hypothetical protein